VNDDGEDEIIEPTDENGDNDDDCTKVDELSGSTASTILRPNL
jgi:hypothetical protein